MKFAFSLLLLLAIALSPAAGAATPGLWPTPTRHGDFAHYTLALTWQPGFLQRRRIRSGASD